MSGIHAYIHPPIDYNSEREEKKDKKKDTDAYIVCWTTQLKNASRQHKKETDQFVVFLYSEYNGEQLTVAKKLFDDVRNKRTTITANITKIIKSTEAHYLEP